MAIKTWQGLVGQQAENAPVVNFILANNFGSELVWTRVVLGRYDVPLPSFAATGNVFITITPTVPNIGSTYSASINHDILFSAGVYYLRVWTFVNNFLSDGVLFNTPIKIEIKI